MVLSRIDCVQGSRLMDYSFCVEQETPSENPYAGRSWCWSWDTWPSWRCPPPPDEERSLSEATDTEELQVVSQEGAAAEHLLQEVRVHGLLLAVLLEGDAEALGLQALEVLTQEVAGVLAVGAFAMLLHQELEGLAHAVLGHLLLGLAQSPQFASQHLEHLAQLSVPFRAPLLLLLQPLVALVGVPDQHRDDASGLRPPYLMLEASSVSSSLCTLGSSSSRSWRLPSGSLGLESLWLTYMVCTVSCLHISLGTIVIAWSGWSSWKFSKSPYEGSGSCRLKCESWGPA